MEDYKNKIFDIKNNFLLKKRKNEENSSIENKNNIKNLENNESNENKICIINQNTNEQNNENNQNNEQNEEKKQKKINNKKKKKEENNNNNNNNNEDINKEENLNNNNQKDNKINSILNFFKKTNNLKRNNSTFTFGQIDNKEYDEDFNLSSQKDFNKEENFPKENEIKFNKLTSKNINLSNKSEYLNLLKNYCNELKINQKNTHKSKQIQKIIYIYDSYVPLKKIPKNKSLKITPKNPLAKDKYLIDYEKDSQDEFEEENAEDIKSNDNDDIEEESEDSESLEEKKFVVPDGHLSEDEISEKDILKERQLFEASKDKIGGIIQILNIRKNFNKPIIIDFKYLNNKDELVEKLKCKIFHFPKNDNLNENLNELNKNEDENLNNNNNNNYSNSDFPIKIITKSSKNNVIKNNIQDHLEDIIKFIHGSFETKENMIPILNERFPDISKKSLNTFFKQKCIKTKHDLKKKNFWLVKEEVLNLIGSNSNIKLDELKEEHLKEFEEKEIKRLKEIEKTREINNLNKEEQNNNNIIIINNNENEIKNIKEEKIKEEDKKEINNDDSHKIKIENNNKIIIKKKEIHQELINISSPKNKEDKNISSAKKTNKAKKKENNIDKNQNLLTNYFFNSSNKNINN